MLNEFKYIVYALYQFLPDIISMLNELKYIVYAIYQFLPDIVSMLNEFKYIVYAIYQFFFEADHLDLLFPILQDPQLRLLVQKVKHLKGGETQVTKRKGANIQELQRWKAWS